MPQRLHIDTARLTEEETGALCSLLYNAACVYYKNPIRRKLAIISACIPPEREVVPDGS